jgi:hypothetical protein
METDNTIMRPIDYDAERLKQFYGRATFRTNLPREYKPDTDVNQAAFADAMIGLYVNHLEVRYADDPKAYQVGLARVAFALNFLEGMKPADLTVAFDELGVTEDDIKIPREYALGVAGIGARHFRNQFGEPAPNEEKPVKPAPEPLPESEIMEPEVQRSHEEFINLGNVIRDLYDQERINSGEAQALLLLFREAQSSALRETQAKVAERIAQHLKARLTRATATQPHKGESLADQVYAKGISHLRMIVNHPVAMVTDNRVYKELITTEMSADRTLTPKTAYEKIRGHIGYVLDKIY